MTLFISRTMMLVPGCFIIVYYVPFFFIDFGEKCRRLNVGFMQFFSGGSWLSLASVASCMCVLFICRVLDILLQGPGAVFNIQLDMVFFYWGVLLWLC